MQSSNFITGSFIQIDHWSDSEGARFQADLRQFDCDDWCESIDDMADLGMDTIIFQQCVDNRTGWDDTRSYYPSKTRKRPDWMRGDLFSAVVRHATERGMKIIYGVGTMYSKNPYLCTDEVIAQARVTAEELLELYGDQPSFGGWYWTYEFPPSSVAGRDSLKKIVPALRAIRDCDVMIAPNLERMTTPSLMDDIDVDIIAYQDNAGLGVSPDTLGRTVRFSRQESFDYMKYCYEMLRYYHDGWQDRAKADNYWNGYFRKRGRVALWNDLEVWEFNTRNELIPAEASRVVAQLEVSAPYVDKQIIYQYTGLMQNPARKRKCGGERAETLYEEYKYYRENLLAGKSWRYPDYYREYMLDRFGGK